MMPGVRRSLTPLTQFVVKIHSRCDLACDHCYVYEAADQSWRGQPMVISDEVISRTAQRIAEHATAHELDTIQIVLHGGEPLLVRADRMRRIITTLHAALRGVCDLDLRIHTNGVRLDERFCELFTELGVKVGISIDGDRAANDRHRRYADGRSSYEHVIRAIGLLRTSRFRHLYAGLLCTIDTANDPVAVYDALIALSPPRIDFLLPHATWDDPPARGPGADSQYAGWLIAIFDRWLAGGRPVGIRTFESILSTLTGGGNLTEALGLAPSSLAVIETDGAYEQVDSLKVAFDGAPATGLNVFEHALDLLAGHPGIAARQQGLAGLCQTCRECPVVTSCGGGLYAHRYRSSTGFANPSVYCADLLKLITHIKSRLPAATAGRYPAAKHGLSDDDFGELAAGYGSTIAIGQLMQGQRTLRRALLGAVYRAADTAPGVPGPARDTARTAWAVLAAADQERPEALDAVLAHPYVRVWAVRCLERLKQSPPAGEPDPALERELLAGLGHLAAIAAVTAIRADDKTEVTIPVSGGAVHLPTLGRLVAGAAGPGPGPHQALVVTNGNTASFRIGEDCWEISHAGLLSGEPATLVSLAGGAADWQPVRRLTAPGFGLALEDTDPYRDCHRGPPAARLTDTEMAYWQRCFAAGWQQIRHDFPGHAPAIEAGLTVLMPISPARPGQDVAAAARNAFGAIGMAPPAGPATLARLLVREFQRVKLNAILDLYDLFDSADTQLYPVPAEGEPRPLGELLQETYARLAVEPDSGQTRDAIAALAAARSLTPLGARFVREMRPQPVQPSS
jgi:uncharacterized protein